MTALRLPKAVPQIAVGYLAAAVVLLFSVLLAFSQMAKNEPVIYVGITYDLVLTAPLALYFLSGRRAPSWTLGLCVAAGIWIAYWVIPVAERTHLDTLRFIALPLLELGLMGGGAYVAIKTFRTLRQNRQGAEIDYLALFQQSFGNAFSSPLVGKFLGAEIAMLYYALFCWRKRENRPDEMSTYRESGAPALLWTLVMLTLIESLIVHILLARWSEWAAWILTALSVYSLLMLLGHINALAYRPHRLAPDALELRLGLIEGISIDWRNIERVEFTSKEVGKELKPTKLSLLGELEPHNTIIYLKEPQHLAYLYGFKKSCRVLLCSIDNRERLKEKLASLPANG